jgi:ABC-2 type transport system ATP-binding protein
MTEIKDKIENEVLIRAGELVKSFKKVKVLDGLDISWYAGERIALIGQNGAGKTTLIRCILGEYVYEGQLEVLNKDPRKNRVDILREVGFVPQIPPPLKMTVKDLLKFFEQISHVKQEVFIDIADRLGLQIRESMSKPFVNLSGGMKQKLLVSFALGREPKVLLMDEPSANLDPSAREMFFELLGKYNPDSLLILSSHRMTEIKGLVNRVVEMDFGKIVLDKQV